MTILPEVRFVSTDPEAIKASVITAYESLTDRKLAIADPVRLFLLSIANVIVEQRVLINDIGKQNLLFYSRDSVLDHKGYAWDTPRLQAEKAKVTMKFIISAIQTSAVIIPKSTRVTEDGELFFETTDQAIIQPGEQYVDIQAECMINGSVGNGYDIGKINMLVDPIPYIQSVENITISEGGSDKEEDEPYRERIHQAPERLSTAGSDDAYMYWAKTASSLIKDVYVWSPSPGETDVRILLDNGELPQQEIIDSVYEVLSSKKVRPLTDYVSVGAPDVVNYELDIVYFIESNVVDMSLIKSNIEKAIADYAVWQKSKIGRDINPSKLISDCMKAGAKRVVVNSPIFTKIDKGQVAQSTSINIVFGGVEDY